MSSSSSVSSSSLVPKATTPYPISPFVIFLNVDGFIYDKGPSLDRKIGTKAKELFPNVPDHDDGMRCIAKSHLFDKAAVTNLTILITELEKTRNVWIVISSNCRKNKTVEELRTKIFGNHTFAKYIIDKTPDEIPSERVAFLCSANVHQFDPEDFDPTDIVSCCASEISFWLQQHPEVSNYAILNDQDDHLSKFREKFFQINHSTPLTKEIYQKILEQHRNSVDVIIREAHLQMDAYDVLANIPITSPIPNPPGIDSVSEAETKSVSTAISSLISMKNASNPLESSPFVIFLDVDGVIYRYSHPYLDKFLALRSRLFPDAVTHDERMDSIALSYLFDQAALANLTNLITELEKTRRVWVVISSNWRINRTVEELRTKIFRIHKFAKYIVDKTPDKISKEETISCCSSGDHQESDVCRASQIKHWLKKHPEVSSYAILDDKDEHLSTEFGARFFKTYFAILLTKEICEQVLLQNQKTADEPRGAAKPAMAIPSALAGISSPSPAPLPSASSSLSEAESKHAALIVAAPKTERGEVILPTSAADKDSLKRKAETGEREDDSVRPLKKQNTDTLATTTEKPGLVT